MKAYRDRGSSLVPAHDWSGSAGTAADKRAAGNRRRKREARRSSRSSARADERPPQPPIHKLKNGAFLPEVDGASHVIVPHNKNRPGSGSEQELLRRSYAELQAAYSKLQLSESSASTHLQQTAQLLATAQAHASECEAKLKTAQQSSKKRLAERDEWKRRHSELERKMSERKRATKAAEGKLAACKNEIIEIKRSSMEVSDFRFADAESRLLGVCEKFARKESSLRNQLKGMVRKVESLQVEFQEARSGAMSQLAEATKELIAKHEKAMESERTSHALEMKSASQAYDAQIASLRSKMEDERSIAHGKLQDAARESRSALVENHAKEISTLRTRLESERDEAMRRCSSMEDLLSTAEAEVTSYKEELSEAQSRASSLGALQNEVETLKARCRQLESEAKNAGALEEENMGLKAKIQELEESSTLSEEREKTLTDRAAQLEESCSKQLDKYNKERSISQKKLDLFKKELSDVRAKQEFAVNEVKLLMAKVATYENSGRGLRVSDADRDTWASIDANLQNLRAGKRKKKKKKRN